MSEPLVDSFGRVHRDLRISVTDRCNFRCTYCMPEEGMKWLPRSEVLTFEEIERIARVCVEHFGIDSIRLTGGEPTVRAHLPILVGKIAALRTGGDGPPVDVSLTTNGATLRSVAPDLAAAGLRRVNVSLDTLRPDRFVELTRRDELDHVLEGIEAAVEAGLHPVKVNAVVMRGVNDDEIVDLAAYGRDQGVTVRFIEWMPLDADERWRSGAVVWPGRDRGRHRRRVPDRPGGAGAPAGRAVRLPRRPRRGRRDPVGDPARSATPATASGSRPRASSGRACSRSTRSTCATSSGAGRPTTSWPARSGAASPTRRPGT